MYVVGNLKNISYPMNSNRTLLFHWQDINIYNFYKAQSPLYYFTMCAEMGDRHELSDQTVSITFLKNTFHVNANQDNISKVKTIIFQNTTRGQVF